MPLIRIDIFIIFNEPPLENFYPENMQTTNSCKKQS